MAKPDWQLKHRDSDRGRGRARDFRGPMREDVVLHVASNNYSSGPRRGNNAQPQPQPPKQGVNGALRAANLRLLLEKAPVREAAALVAEVPLERLEAMSRGALCPDETAFHIERALKLPGKWLDGLNKDVPERTLELLKHPDKVAMLDDDFDEEILIALPVVDAAHAQPATAVLIADQPEAVVARAPGDDALTQQGQHPGTGTTTSATSNQQQALEITDSAGTVLAEGETTPARAAVQASKAIIAAVQPRSSAAVSRSKPDSKITHPMPSPELRHQNLSLLLQGKGAKSALARLIGISQPYMSTIANGGKVLDEAFCQNMAQALGMPADWFEAPRKAADIPATALQRLAPLPRGKAASASAAQPSDLTDAPAAAAATAAGEAVPMAAEAAVEPNESPTTVTGMAQSHAAAMNTSGTGSELEEEQRHILSEPQRESQQRSASIGQASEPLRTPATAPVQADLLSQMEPVQAPAQQTPLAGLAEAIAIPAMVLEPAPAMAAVVRSAPQAVQRTRDLTTVPAQPLILDGGLPPITEALIKVLALKARQGALSEDKAFELLGAVRLL